MNSKLIASYQVNNCTINALKLAIVRFSKLRGFLGWVGLGNRGFNMTQE
jgi:hypothetical protein